MRLRRQAERRWYEWRVVGMRLRRLVVGRVVVCVVAVW